MGDEEFCVRRRPHGAQPPRKRHEKDRYGGRHSEHQKEKRDLLGDR